MKKLILAFFFVLLLINAKAQVNLIVNPSFEDTVNCPVGAGEIYKTSGWSSYKGSPDYLNSCSSPGFVSVPYNFGGYQQAASGNAYAAFITFAGIPNYREIIGRQLLTILNVGTKYFVSFKVALSIFPSSGCVYASDKMGINFSSIPFDASHPAPLINSAKVYSPSIITDTLNWTKIFGSFIADSAYSYVMFGNFFDDSNTDTIKFNTTTDTPNAYYYLDDVCLSTDSIFALNYVYTGINEQIENSNVTISPNPATNYVDVSIPDNTEYAHLSIYNIFGQVLVRTENINASTARIDIADLTNGIYFLQIIYKNKIFNNKLIKQ